MVSYRCDCSICSLTKLHHSFLALSHSGGGLFCAKKVVKRPSKPSGIVSKLAEPEIAVVAKQSADLAGGVVVIDAKAPVSSSVPADGANPSLRICQLPELLCRESVCVEKRVFP